MDTVVPESGVSCPNCGFGRGKASIECARCGIVFEKYRRAREDQSLPLQPQGHSTAPTGRGNILLDLFFHVPPETNPLAFGARALLLGLLTVWGLKLAFASIAGNGAGNSVLHYVNLPFHEAGHVLFKPFGPFVSSIGGTLGQLLMPLVCLLVLLLKTRDPFGAAVALWWLGENFIDIAPYIDDARSLSLPLLGGNYGDSSPYGFHDWEYILTEMDLLAFDHAMARASHLEGALLMAVAVAWGASYLFRQWPAVRSGSFR
jgi:hypothetical protein